LAEHELRQRRAITLEQPLNIARSELSSRASADTSQTAAGLQAAARYLNTLPRRRQ
jgi:hypothetical protein